MQKRLSKLALLAVAAAFIVAGFPACSDDDEGEPPAPVLESIYVQTNPTKMTYQVDEDFDPAGLVITEAYNNKTTTDVPYTEANKSDFKFDFDFSVANPNVTVKVTYKEKTAEITVSVAATKPDPDKELASIAVKTNPTKLTYTVGDTMIDPNGLVITVTYTDNKTDDIVYGEANKDDFKFDFDFSAANPNVTVTVTYKEKETTFTVNVAANEPDSTKELASIAVKDNPTKLTYTVGDTALDPDGLVITVTYTDNKTDDIAYSEANKADFKFDFDFSTAKDNVTVTITYKEKETTFTVNVAANEPDPDKTLASIAVEKNPTKTTYKVDEDFDPNGLVITVTYTDNKTDDIGYGEANKDDFKFTGFDSSEPNDNVTVTVTYKEKTATFTVSVKEKGTEPTPATTLTGIKVKTNPTKTAYTVGEDFDPTGLVITAKYSDDSTKDITYSEANKADFDFKGFDATKAGDVTVTVTYKEKTATFAVSVAEAEKSLFETLSAQANNVLKEDFATFTVTKFGAGFGKVGVYGDDGVTVADGAISTGAAGTNRKIYVDFGPVKETVEGCVTLTVGGTQPQSGKSLLTFYNGDSAFLTLKTETGNNAVIGTAGTYEIYYKFDLAAKTVSLTVNGKAVLTDSALTADSVSGYTIESHNGGKGTITADDIAVCATAGDLGTYKAQVKAWLATLVANSYSEEKGYKINKNAVDQAKSNGDSAIDGAADVDAVLAAYGNAKTALSNVKNDVAQTKENACTELDAYFPEGKTAESYTKDQLTAVAEAKETGKTAINAANSVEAVNTALADAKAKIDALPDNSATAYTVTVKDSDGNDLGTVTAYTTVESVLDEIKKLITDPTKVIAGGKFYTDQACATEYDTATELTGDVTVYVTLEENKTTTYVLTPDMLGTDWTNPASNTMTSITTDGVMFKAGNNVTYDSATKSIKTGGSCQKNGKNAIVFTTTGKSTVTVLFFGTNADRNVGYIKGTDQSAVSSSKWVTAAVQGTEVTKGTTEIVTTVFSISEAGTYSLGGINGLNITKITVEVEN